MRAEYKPRIGITMGDPAGIGPEIIIQALSEPDVYEWCRPLVVGDLEVLRQAVEIVGSDFSVRPIASVPDAEFREGAVDVLDLDNIEVGSLILGKVSAKAGKAAFEYIARAIELAMSKELDATVTCPIHKEALNAAGYQYAGHTEIYRDLTGAEQSFMMLAAGNFRTVHVSTHVSLRKACELVENRRVLAVIEAADLALRELGIDRPRIAVAGLNPHAGESGLFGDEETREIIPAIEEAQRKGIDADGPHPPDTIFSKARGGQYDIVVAMYHDQGHIPLKVVGFQLDENGKDWKSVSGVNITLGLPIIRVSVDHGTAFDRAGKGNSRPESLVDALRIASRMARAKRMRQSGS